MDTLSVIRRPIERELEEYAKLFDEALRHEDDYLGQALSYIGRRKGKMMRPVLVLLMAKELGAVREASLRSAVTLELLHTASLVHDDVVDESGERRGQRSANAVYGSKVAVLVGDYLLSSSLLQATRTGDMRVVELISRLGGTLSEGEVCQLANIRRDEVSEEAYFHIISRKTAALFAACAELGAISAGADEEYVEKAGKIGEIIGICFQIRDDIFDYYADSAIGKPTGNDMAEGKVTLPAIYAYKHSDDPRVREWVRRVKSGEATQEEISALVEHSKECGGIDYARRKMEELRTEAASLLSSWKNEEVREALKAYVDYVVDREN